MALEECLSRSSERRPDRKVALIVDGLDHVTRIHPSTTATFDPAHSVSAALAGLRLPPGAVVIVLSQPGEHLAPLFDEGAVSATMPGLSFDEIRELVQMSGFPTTVEGVEEETRFISAVDDRARGNALYATYLCREAHRSDRAVLDPVAAVGSLPPFDGTLRSYYEHLARQIHDQAESVADVIALLEFAVTRDELREILPLAAHHVDRTIDVLQPVLTGRAAQGGIRLYHESFGRFLRERFRNEPTAVAALLELVTDWLDGRGLFTDGRAFRWLLPLLAEAGKDDRVLELAGGGFVANAITHGFPTSGICRNLSVAVAAAGRHGNWPAMASSVEWSRAADAYQSERFEEIVVQFADVAAAVLGTDTLSERMLDDGRPALPARAGVQMCAAVDRLGGLPPWREYLDALPREQDDQVSYSRESDHAVLGAMLRGALRVHEDINWAAVAAIVDDGRLSPRDVVEVVAEIRGWKAIADLVAASGDPGDLCLSIAEALAIDDPAGVYVIGSPLHWACEAIAHGVIDGSVPRLLRLGVQPERLAEKLSLDHRDLPDLTRQVQQRSATFDGGEVGRWLDACALTARIDPIVTAAAEATVAGEGWYPCWLRFALALALAEAQPADRRSAAARIAIDKLTGDLRPYAGEPRAIDLYSVRDDVETTIAQAAHLLTDEDWGDAMRILKRVSDAVGLAVLEDLILRLAVDGARSTRFAAAREVVAQYEDEPHGEYYSQLAGRQLHRARLELAAGDPATAFGRWKSASALLAGYGWRKDVTIYELLDPLPALIEQDPAAARERIASVQGLCIRVTRHTDGKETRHAPRRWWGLLAQADPVSATRLAARRALSRANDPDDLPYEVFEDVWRNWHGAVDPLVSAALRVTLGTPLDHSDPDHLERLALAAGSAGTETPFRELITWLLARADERPTRYTVSNSQQLIDREDALVDRINELARRLAVGQVAQPPDKDCHQTSDPEHPRSTDSAIDPQSVVLCPAIKPGPQGIAEAMRWWRSRPTATNDPRWSPTRLVNAVGYRLVELEADGRHDEATAAVRSFAELAPWGDQEGLLEALAQGLDRHGTEELAALAYALTWTRARGHGGWLKFGGTTRLAALHRATMLAPSVVSSVVADEVERTVASLDGGTYGIAQALILALADGALTATSGDQLGEAFAVWDSSFGAIAARTPRTDESDDPLEWYVPLEVDPAMTAPGNLDQAFSLAAVAGVAHASREQKRRVLLATRLLLERRPASVADAVATALEGLSDPATTSWLLQLVSSHAPAEVVDICQPALASLLDRDHIVVRAIARRLTVDDEAVALRSTPALPELTRAAGGGMWLPDEPVESASGEPPYLVPLLRRMAGQRLREGERILPGLAASVRARLRAEFESEALNERLAEQHRRFADTSENRWPDAFLAREEAIECAIQSIAAAGRQSLFAAGQPIAAPVAWEDSLAEALADNPELPALLESKRIPRPRLSAPPPRGDGAWSTCATPSDGESDLSTTVEVGPYTAAPSADAMGGGWQWLGTVEWREFSQRHETSRPRMLAERYRAIEVRNSGDSEGLDAAPLAEGDLAMWLQESVALGGWPEIQFSQPLAGIDHTLSAVGDGRHSLGVASPILVPMPQLVALLDVQPGEPFTFVDDLGMALKLSLWRAEYDSLEHYHLPYPRTTGAGLAIRADLLSRLAAAVGSDRLVFRDYVAGSAALATTSR